jgi:hypothetical protein
MGEWLLRLLVCDGAAIDASIDRLYGDVKEA